MNLRFEPERRSSFAKPILVLTIGLFLASPLAPSQAPTSEIVPEELLGKWKVVRVLPTKTVSCWGDKDAKQVVGTIIEYAPGSIHWNNQQMRITRTSEKVVTAGKFHDENSGGGAGDSQIDFRQLGIRQERSRQIELEHAPARLTGATVEFPGDNVLVKQPDSIVFSLCNLYFEAKRVHK